MRLADRETLLRYLLIVSILLLCLLCCWLLFGPLWGILGQGLRLVAALCSPFLCGWLLSMLLRPGMQWFTGRLHLSPGWAAALLLALLLLLLLGMLLLLTSTLLSLLDALLQEAPRIELFFAGLLRETEAVLARLGLGSFSLAQYGQQLQASLGEWLSRAAVRSLRLLQSGPSAMLWCLVMLLAAFYFCRDGARSCFWLCRYLPGTMGPRLGQLYQDGSRLLAGYIRAETVLIGISAALSGLGLALCGVKGALRLGLLTGVLDIIPFFGPGLVLLGCSLSALLRGEMGRAIALAVVWFLVILSRQILDPKLLGDGLGLPPLLALAAVFLGTQLFGLLGAVIGPLLTGVLLTLIRVHPGSVGKCRGITKE